MTEEKEKVTGNEKPVKKSEKYIWLAVSVVIAAAGAICHLNEIRFNIWVSVIYSALLLFTIIMSAQRTSLERFAYSNSDDKKDKTKYLLSSILYYILIIIAVVYSFLALWVSGVFSI